jgi:hypothetical protein
MAINWGGFPIQTGGGIAQTGTKAMIENARNRKERERAGIASSAQVAMGQDDPGVQIAWLQQHKNEELQRIGQIADPRMRQMALEELMKQNMSLDRMKLARAGADKSLGAPYPITVDGKKMFAAPMQRGGKPVIEYLELPEGAQFISRGLGETAEEQSTRLANEALKKKLAQYQAEIESAHEIGDIRAKQAAQAKAAEARATLSGNRYANVSDSGYNAAKIKPIFDELQVVLEAIDTGAYQPAINWFKKYTGQDVADSELFRAQVLDMTIDALMQMPGVKTDEDFKQKLNTMMREGNSKGANLALLNYHKQKIERDMLAMNQIQIYKEVGGKKDFADFIPRPDMDLQTYEAYMYYQNRANKKKDPKKYKRIEEILRKKRYIQ